MNTLFHHSSEPSMRGYRFRVARRLGGALLAFSLLVMSAQAWAEVKVAVREASQAKGQWVLLKTVASIAAPEAIKDKIGDIQLCRSPLPGRSKRLSGRHVLSLLAATGELPKTAKVSVPESIHITRQCQHIREDRLRALYKGYIAEHLKGAAFKVRRFGVRGDNRFATGALSYRVEKNFNPEFKGTVALRLRVFVDGKEDGCLALQGWVDRFGRVVCARRPVRYNSILTAADLELKTVNMAAYPAGLITELAGAVGQLCKVTLFPGSPVRTCMLGAVPLVARGERVEILAASGGLRVSTLGIAKTAGGMGQQVQVQNIHSGKTVVGRVTGDATVEVLF
jgi:flagella basal body P-ring formation protein FlgA